MSKSNLPESTPVLSAIVLAFLSYQLSIKSSKNDELKKNQIQTNTIKEENHVLHKKIKEHATLIQKLEKDMKDLKKYTKDAQHKIAGANIKWENMRVELMKRQVRISELEGRLADDDEELMKRQEHTNVLQGKIQQLESKLSQRHESNHILENKANVVDKMVVESNKVGDLDMGLTKQQEDVSHVVVQTVLHDAHAELDFTKRELTEQKVIIDNQKLDTSDDEDLLDIILNDKDNVNKTVVENDSGGVLEMELSDQEDANHVKTVFYDANAHED